MRLLGSAPKSHLCDQKRRSKVTGLSDLMTLFIDLACLYCKQTQRAFNVFKNTLNWLKIDSVDQKFYWLECGNFSQDAGTSGTERVIAFSQLAVKGLNHWLRNHWFRRHHQKIDVGHWLLEHRLRNMDPPPLKNGWVVIKYWVDESNDWARNTFQFNSI
jgi:hypothetical protein